MTAGTPLVADPHASWRRRVEAGFYQVCASKWWPVIPLVVYAVTRLVTSFIVGFVYQHQKPNTFTGPTISPAAFAAMWDGRWYRRIAEHGYPMPIPSDEDGNAHQSEWAFFPAYPMMARLGSAITGWDFAVTGVVVNLILGAVLAVLLFDLCATRLAPMQAALATALVLTFPASPVLQFTYTEALALICVVAGLRLLAARAYWAALLPVTLLAVTRPIAVPFGLVVLVHLIHRWRRRDTEPLSVVQAMPVLVLGAYSAVTSVAFPLWVGGINGEWGAYNRVQASWHGGDLGYVIPWLEAGERLLGPVAGQIGVLLLVGVVAAAVYRGRRVMGLELAAWVGAYSGYLLVVLQPWSSLFRYLIFLFPLAVLAAVFVRSAAHAATWLWSMVSLQVVWLSWLWHFSPPYDMPP